VRDGADGFGEPLPAALLGQRDLAAAVSSGVVAYLVALQQIRARMLNPMRARRLKSLTTGYSLRA